ncbi:MAG: AAA family ATPase [Solirubrobacteraceae bacterium]
MSDQLAIVLERLARLGFHTRAGGMTPFGESMPLVQAVAWDPPTGQLALLAEAKNDASIEEWRQLLFAAAGLRHNLSDDGATAFGAPLILALADEGGWRRLRELAEDLVTNYVLFNRVDLNLVRVDDVGRPGLLDDALAPLLPRCREMLDEEISRADVERFWGMLREEVTAAAANLDGIFAPYRERTGERLAELLIAEDEHSAQLPSPFPLKHLAVRNFRSIRAADVAFPPVTILHGPNGGGKSSLLEAMELVWAGTSQRKPAAVSPREYERHLPRNGKGDFLLTAEDTQITSVSASPRAELARNVLTHESVAALVSQSPEERYAALLATTGLAMPDLAARAQSLLDEAKSAADRALTAAGVPPLPRRDSRAEKHLREKLSGNFARRLPAATDLTAAEETLGIVSRGAYTLRPWPREEQAAAALVHADRVIGRQIEQPSGAAAVAKALDDAYEQVSALVAPRREAVTAFRRLLQQTAAPVPSRAASAPALAVRPPLAQEVTIRWLTHANSLRTAAAQFARDADALEDATWAQRLKLYAAALDEAVKLAPTTELDVGTERVGALVEASDRGLVAEG